MANRIMLNTTSYHGAGAIDEIYDFLYKISKMAYKIPKNPYKNKWPNITLLKAKKLLNIFGNILQNINTISKKYVKI